MAPALVTGLEDFCSSVSGEGMGMTLAAVELAGGGISGRGLPPKLAEPGLTDAVDAVDSVPTLSFSGSFIGDRGAGDGRGLLNISGAGGLTSGFCSVGLGPALDRGFGDGSADLTSVGFSRSGDFSAA